MVSRHDTNAARIFQTDDGWHVDTREGNVGPFLAPIGDHRVEVLHQVLETAEGILA